MKKKSVKQRNPFIILAKTKKGGLMKNKKNKRRNGRNNQEEFLNEDY